MFPKMIMLLKVWQWDLNFIAVIYLMIKPLKIGNEFSNGHSFTFWETNIEKKQKLITCGWRNYTQFSPKVLFETKYSGSFYKDLIWSIVFCNEQHFEMSALVLLL